MVVTGAEAGVDAGRRDDELRVRRGRIGLVELELPDTSVNVPRTVVTIMCLAEKRTSVWAGSIANVAMGWFLCLGAAHRAGAAVS